MHRKVVNSSVRNIYFFSLFNAFSFQVVLGAPMVLYAKSLDASATLLGLIAGLTPLLVVFQIPAARYVDIVGYKRFVLSGWTARTFVVGMVALIPVSASWLPASSRLALLFFLLFWFNLIRGVSGCGWLPWISEVIPAEIRGRYLTLDATIVNLASFVVCWLAAAVLGGLAFSQAWHYSLLFAFSAVCAALSLRFLNRIPPETKVDATMLPPRPRLPQMLKSPGYARVLVFNIFWSLASGGLVTFVISFLKGFADWPEQRILTMMSFMFLGGIGNQLLLPHILDKRGSKPVILGAAFLWIGIAVGWMLNAGGVWNSGVAGIAALLFGVGLANSMMNLANVRLVMLTVPERGRTHYFAVYSVVANLVLGCAPILWGILLDAWGDRSFLAGGLVWNRYAALFLLFTVCFFFTGLSAVFLVEPGAVSLRRLLAEAMEFWRIRYWMSSLFRVPPKG